MTAGLGSSVQRISSPRARRALRRVAFAAIAVVIGSGIGLVTYQIDVQPGAAIVKAVFESGTEVSPPADFAVRERMVVENGNIPIAGDGGAPATMDIFTPTAVGPPHHPMILWLHGGGFISSSPDTVRDYTVLLASDGYVVASLDYSLAPGARYPTPVIQANAALVHLQQHAREYGGDPARIFVGGDSAGGQIAGELAAAQTNPQLAAALDISPAVTGKNLRGVILFCGLYDMRTVGGSGFPALRTYLWAYTGTREWVDDPHIDELSTTRQATPQYPPTFLTVGDSDPFAGQAEELAGRLKELGVPVTTAFWSGTGAGLGHEYQFNFTLPQAVETYTATLHFLEDHAGE